ncbi:MAG: carboxypeptidase-like regulatory domain-containing protein, partial [Cyclobacteriaceae bacterium]|nr:carboxypeptidase-like regulatory domain-containing protein [Cyclobacteriaceae bacterium]
MKIYSPLIPLAIILSTLCNAQMPQSTNIIHGKVLDNSTNLPVPYASISIAETKKGTSADEHGNFSLAISIEDANKKIQISSIGYETKKFTQPKTEKRHTFSLQPSIEILDELLVVGDSINSKDLVKDAIRSIQINYVQSPFNCEYYSQMTISNNTKKDTTLAECIIAGYYPGYLPSGKRRFEIREAKISGDDFFRGRYIPTHEIRALDVIANPEKFGVFNEENHQKIKFRYEGSTLYENDTVLKISYIIPKPTRKITGYGVNLTSFKGSLVIKAGTLAIVQHSIETNRISSTIVYRKIDKFYYAYSIRGVRSDASANPNESPYTIQ